MARQAGVSTLTPLTLTQLNAIMKDYPNVPIQVGKGCIASLEKALGVSFGVSGTPAPSVATVDAEPAKAVAQVD